MSTVTLGGQARRLSYPFGSVKRLKQERGVNLLKLKDVDLLDPSVISALVWAGLLVETPALTESEVDGWIELPRLGEITTAVADAILEGQGMPGPLTSGASSGATADAPPIG